MIFPWNFIVVSWSHFWQWSGHGFGEDYCNTPFWWNFIEISNCRMIVWPCSLRWFVESDELTDKKISFMVQKTPRKLVYWDYIKPFWGHVGSNYQTTSGPIHKLLFNPNFIEISLSIGLQWSRHGFLHI